MGLKFIDLCAGVGGFRIAAENLGHRCVFTSEWDPNAQATYFANFGGVIHGDITRVEPTDIPDFDLLLAGFPCQAFSTAGRWGKERRGEAGFDDPVKGTVFFYVARIIKVKRPKYFVLENVRGLLSCDHGRAFTLICDILDKIGYDITYKVVNSQFCVPQRRNRVYIVGTRKGEPSYVWPNFEGNGGILADVLEPDEINGEENHELDQYTLTEEEWGYYVRHMERRVNSGRGTFGTQCRILDPSRPAHTLIASYCHNPESHLVHRPHHKTPRRLTVNECKRIMGFPASFAFPVTRYYAYKQLGNAVVPGVVECILANLPNIS